MSHIIENIKNNGISRAFLNGDAETREWITQALAEAREHFGMQQDEEATTSFVLWFLS